MIADFNAMIQTAKRDDDYINATKLCEEFGARWSDFRENKKHKQYIQALELKLGSAKKAVLKTRVGRKYQMYVHPLLAIHLAQWLNPDFAIAVAQVFKAYIEADPELAKDVINRQTDVATVEDIEETAKARKKYLTSYRPLMDTIKDVGGDRNTYMNIQKLNNKAITGKTNDQLRAEHKVSNARDALSPQELTELSVLQSWQSGVIAPTNQARCCPIEWG